MSSEWTYRQDAISKDCTYGKLCERYLRSLNLPEKILIQAYDYCFCNVCHTARGDNDVYKRGFPPQNYILPRGWRRYRLHVEHIPEGFTVKEIFKIWHVAYHGTRTENLVSIWEIGFNIPVINNDTRFYFINFHGRRGNGSGTISSIRVNEAIEAENYMCEKSVDGAEIKPCKQHFNYKFGPENFDWEQIFVSPSPTYAGFEAYFLKQAFYDSETKKLYKCQVVLQLRIRPGSYTVGPEIVGRNNIDRYVRDIELEWSTKDTNATMVTGLLVRVQ